MLSRRDRRCTGSGQEEYGLAAAAGPNLRPPISGLECISQAWIETPAMLMTGVSQQSYSTWEVRDRRYKNCEMPKFVFIPPNTRKRLLVKATEQATRKRRVSDTRYVERA